MIDFLESPLWLRIMQFVIFLTIASGFVWQSYRMKVIRRLDLIDREEARKALEERLRHVEAITVKCQYEVLVLVQESAKKLAALKLLEGEA